MSPIINRLRNLVSSEQRKNKKLAEKLRESEHRERKTKEKLRESENRERKAQEELRETQETLERYVTNWNDIMKEANNL